MGRAVFAYRNLADSGIVSASSSLSLTPPSRLTAQFPQIAKKCRNNGENSWAVIVDLLAVQSVDLFALFGLNVTSAATARFRLSLADSSGQAGDVYDSGPVSGLVDARYGALIRRLTAPLEGRYVRIDVTESGLPYIEAGRVLVSLSAQPAINFAPGWARSRIDQSRPTASENGVLYFDRRPKIRQVDVTFEFLSEAEVNGFVEDMDERNGETDDVLLMFDSDSSNPGRDSIWGTITGGQPVVAPYPTPDINSRKYTIKERL